VDQELTQIDYRSGMLTDNRTPNDLPVFLAEQLVVLVESVVVAGEPNTGVDAVGRPAVSSHDGVVGWGNDVQDG
jgi:hypothetical protein